MKRFVASILLGLSCGVAASATGSPAAAGGLGGPPDAQLLEGLSALHQGRFTEGQSRFREFAERSPQDPRGPLFLAFAEWWKLLQLRGVGESPSMELQLQEAIRLSQEKLQEAPGDPETLANLGTSYIFLAQYRAAQRKVFRAAVAAKKGKSLLEEALRSNPELIDSRFGLGAYNYYADKVNALVKGLRTMMFLPGGNSEMGLAQLQEVASRGRYFRTEAHLLLAIIYQGRHERRYRKSLEELRAALALNPDSPVMLMSLGELEIRLGRYPEAQATLRRAVRVSRTSSDRDRSELGRLSRILLSDSLDLALRCPEALDELETALNGEEVPPEFRARALAVATRASTRLGDARRLQKIYAALGVTTDEAAALKKQYGAAESSGEVARSIDPALKMMETNQWDGALRLLGEAAKLHPGSPEIRLHQARALFEQRKWKEAETALRGIPASGGGAAPGWVVGWRDLYLGRSLLALGRRSEARSLYGRAADTDGFRSKDLARALLGPEGEDPGIWPPRIFGLGIEEPKNTADVGLGLPEGRNASISVDRVFTGVVGR
ncbi:MAG TPA: tetratricopeptide repeat protein [Candidatus Polarisedimenticolia bacterium]|jgi:tetratricopeptide (TPR) repeat protein|nr:tetratricopeptide repeat protein [Candidatus Polarisedimenticolia bacterium]